MQRHHTLIAFLLCAVRFVDGFYNIIIISQLTFI